MNKLEEIINANRDFRNAVRDLFNADYNTYDSKGRGLFHLITTNPILTKLLNPYLCKTLDRSRIEQINPNSFGKLELPLEKDDRIAYGLQVLKQVACNEHFAISYAQKFFYNQHIITMLGSLNQQLFLPVFRDIYNMLDDLQAQNKEPIRADDTTHGNIIIQKLTINGPGVIGHNANQATINYNGPKLEQILSVLSRSGISSEDSDKIRSDIEDLIEEVKKAHPESSRIQKILSKIGSVTMHAVPIISTILNHPEVAKAAKRIMGF